MPLSITNHQLRPILVPMGQDFYSLFPGLNLNVPEELVSYAQNHETICQFLDVGLLSIAQPTQKQSTVVDTIINVPVSAADGRDGKAQPVVEVKKATLPREQKPVV